MKIVFFGSSEFAVKSLKKLAESKNEIVCVVTQPDRKKGRHLLFSATVVKSTAADLNLQVLQPVKIDSSFIEALKNFEADIFVVVAYGLILPKALLTIPGKMPINAHASLLPKYRGAAPVNWAIIKGENKTGVTIIKMNERMDEGQIISQEEIEIDQNDTAQTLDNKLSVLGAELLVETVEKIDSIKLTKQDSQKVTYAPKLKKEDGLIDWSKKAIEIHNQIRGTIPWPGSFTHWQGKLLKIWKSSVLPSEKANFKPGEIIDVSKDGVLVATGKDTLKIDNIQLESSNKMDVAQFILGHEIKKSDILS